LSTTWLVNGTSVVKW